MGRLLREPLLHFVALGALLFAVYGFVRDHTARRGAVVVDRSRADALAAEFEKVQQRPPTPAELGGLVDTWVRDEILYREGLATGMDRDDPVIRRRVIQKMVFMGDSMIADTPTDADLHAWLETHAAEYRMEPTWSFRHVFFDPARHGDRLRRTLAHARATLARDATEIGDPTLLPSRLEFAPASEVTAVFGPQFVEGLSGVPVGEWHGPIRSSFGVHLVRVEAHAPSRAASLADVRQAVERDLLKSRMDAVGKAFYAAIRERYRVEVDVPSPSTLMSSAEANASAAKGVGQ
jgi:hypothetical protein